MFRSKHKNAFQTVQYPYRYKWLENISEYILEFDFNRESLRRYYMNYFNFVVSLKGENFEQF